MSNQPAPMTPATATATDKYNVLAIVGFILSFFVALIGAILSLVALSQIKRTGERGRGLAIAGAIIGFVATALVIVEIIVAVAVASANLN